MHKYKLSQLVEYNDEKPVPKVLMNRPGYRMLLINMRAGQKIPEHATKEMVTVYALSGHITFYAGQLDCDLFAGEVLCVDGGASHRLEAHVDSALLVLAAGGANPSTDKILDLREIPRPQRHSLVFARFDGLGVGDSFVLINDHDPVPLSRQMAIMRPGQMVWEYIERGPVNFCVCVRRIATTDDAERSAQRLPPELQEIRNA